MRLKTHLKSILFFTVLFCINYNVLSQNNGPTAPEAVGFEPVDATDMVNLTNGNLAYVLPLMDVAGFPINLSYHAGITPNLEASWVGLGWYLNPGAINRATNGTPDDWKEGIGITFTSYDETTTYFSITASASVPGASVGIGANWGGGQGLSGSIQANIGVASIYADTRGNVAGSIGVGSMNASFSNNSKPNYSIATGGSFDISDDETGSIGYSNGNVSASYSGAKGSVGMSFSGGGNFSIGGVNAKGVGGGVSSSSSSDSQGDATIDTKSIGMSITLPIGPISVSLGFKKTRVRVSILKGYENREWGALYASDYNDFTYHGTNGDREPLIERSNTFSSSLDGFTDYMYRGNKLDTYSTRLPQSEEEFIGDYSKQIENINFTFMAYDDYSVSAQGMMGSLTPHVFENANIIGKGTRATRMVNGSEEPIHAFWHHGTSTNNVQRSLTNSSKPFEFYFNGQFTQTEKNDASAYDATNLSSLSMDNFFNYGSHNGAATGSNRAHQGNFVEVFTNQEIANGQAYGLMTPKDTPNNLRDNTAYFDPNGIGAYKITAADGKTYHFSLPVYHYEKVKRSQLEQQETNDFDCDDVNESRQFTRYATHWLLTAVTGPDYIDRPDPSNSNTSGTFNKEDYGYWIELEYGKWSDGFVWRSPYQDFVYDYNTNITDEIEEEDKGYYQFGRKQMYYLDRINSKNRTALFVKDIRYDGIGKALTYKFSNQNNSGGAYPNEIGNSGNGQNENSLNYTNPRVHVKEDNITYPREYSLRLDKIILVDADDASLINEAVTSNLGSVYPSYTADMSTNPLIHANWASPYFEDHYGTNYSYDIHQEQNVLDKGDLPVNFVENYAIKVVQLNHDYQLVKDTPSSKIGNNTYGGNSDAGKLTLNSVTVLGRGGTQFMPATTFNYYNSNTITNPNTLTEFLPLSNTSQNNIQTNVKNRRNFVDAWGYMQGTYVDNAETRSQVDLWSLKEITSPTGATIKIDYEEDDYWTEAFARRYWENKQLEFMFDTETIDGTSRKTLSFRVDPNDSSAADIQFSDYFNVGEKAFLDVVADRNYPGSGFRYAFVSGGYTVYSIQNNIIKFVLPLYATHTGGRTTANCNQTPYYSFNNEYNDIIGWHSYFLGSGSNGCNSGGETSNDNTLYKFKLLANKVPEDETGGGLRVKEIVTTEGSNTYKATYDYTHPTETDNNGNPRSSGITSYAPVNGLKYVPYQSEVPPPGVMYEYVTMSETDASGNYNAKTRYRHHVLKPVLNIFNPEIELEILDSDAPLEDELFWANVTENAGGLDGNNAKAVEAKKIDIHINTALFGQVKSIEVLNTEDQVLNKTEHQYANGIYLGDSDSERGYIKETFNSLKTVFVSNEDGTSVANNDTKRLLSISSKTDYKNMLKKTISSSGGHQSIIEYSDLDPWLSSFRKSETTMADGTKIQSTRVPAYDKYTNMQSKVLHPDYKNMLTQEAMSISKVEINGVWKTLNASITTWNGDDWSYRDAYGNESLASSEIPVWRKHKTYVWKDGINATTGVYNTTITENNNYFDWGLGIPTNSNWQNVSEITKYTHWSSPVETKDINGNFAASKMADNFSKVVAGGNARHSEMFFSGAEYVASGNTFDGGVLGANFRTNEEAHTGDYSVKNNVAADKVFEISKPINSDVEINALRPEIYKVSFWFFDGDGCGGIPSLTVNGNANPLSEKVNAGQWAQYNYYVDLTSQTGTLNLSVTSNALGHYFDDFRMHPVYASMNSYVYDPDTDELTHILNANNLATKYVYDPAGRLCKTYKEVVNGQSFSGGFKLISKNEYNYKNQPGYDCGDCCDPILQ